MSNFSLPTFNSSLIQLVECPRDAMQGWPHFIPTEQKVEYLNALLKVGFDVLDCGSFVSSKVIPQMADTALVIPQLNLTNTRTKLLTIVANERGATEAIVHEQISYLGFPFSISPTFQQRNTNSTIEESFKRVANIQELCVKNNRSLVVYLSMGFGNPYGDTYDEDILLQWTAKIAELDINIISLADTVGLATPEQISSALIALIPTYPEIEVGVHLHATQNNWQPKLQAAINAGCKRVDGALKGIGGCPMAQDDLVGNMDTELMIPYLIDQQMLSTINTAQLILCSHMASRIFQSITA